MGDVNFDALLPALLVVVVIIALIFPAVPREGVRYIWRRSESWRRALGRREREAWKASTTRVTTADLKALVLPALVFSVVALVLWMGRFEIVSRTDTRFLVLDRWAGSATECFLVGEDNTPTGAISALHSECFRVFPSDRVASR